MRYFKVEVVGYDWSDNTPEGYEELEMACDFASDNLTDEAREAFDLFAESNGDKVFTDEDVSVEALVELIKIGYVKKIKNGFYRFDLLEYNVNYVDF